MARRIQYAELESRTARDRLKSGGRIHWRALDPGKLSLGYRRRKSTTPGEWLKRVYEGSNGLDGGRYKQSVIAIADDFSDADGEVVLDFGQAQLRARDKDRPSGPFTVRDAVALYLEHLKANGKGTAEIENRANANIIPQLGNEQVSNLTSAQISRWRAAYADSPAMIRTGKGKPRRYKKPPADDEAIRRRRSSANRMLTILKAALNHAFDEGKVANNSAWGRRVKPYRGVDAARARYLSKDEAARLINAAAPDFKLLVRGALETGARYSELARLVVADFNPDAGTLHVRKSKSGKSRQIILTEEGAAFFDRITAGRAGDELMFRHEARVRRALVAERERRKRLGLDLKNITVEDGGEWRKSEPRRQINEALDRAKISPRIGFHGLRHSWASHAVMGGVPLIVVAKNLGHHDTGMVEKHYGHLAPSFVVEAIRAGAPRWSNAEPSNVARLDAGKRRRKATTVGEKSGSGRIRAFPSVARWGRI
jgi:integrase